MLLINSKGSGGGGGKPPQCSVKRYTGGDYNVNGRDWTDIDDTNLSITLTTGASWVLIFLTGSVYVSSFGLVGFDVTIDGDRVGQTFGIVRGQYIYELPLCAMWLCQVSAGEHTFRPQYKTTAGFLTLRASADYTPAQFGVIELL